MTLWKQVTKVVPALVGFVLICLPPEGKAGGCTQDEDCVGTDRCLFTYDEQIGECADLNLPLTETNRIDITTGVDTTLIRGGKGYPCQFSIDCQPGYLCFKKMSSFDGQCIASRSIDHR